MSIRDSNSLLVPPAHYPIADDCEPDDWLADIPAAEWGKIAAEDEKRMQKRLAEIRADEQRIRSKHEKQARELRRKGLG